MLKSYTLFSLVISLSGKISTVVVLFESIRDDSNWW